jgi:hypothetical protein
MIPVTLRATKWVNLGFEYRIFKTDSPWAALEKVPHLAPILLFILKTAHFNEKTV